MKLSRFFTGFFFLHQQTSWLELKMIVTCFIVRLGKEMSQKEQLSSTPPFIA